MKELEIRLKELEDENLRLKIVVKELQSKLFQCQRRLNREIEHSYNSVYFDREDR